jgi:hypothetical protein
MFNREECVVLVYERWAQEPGNKHSKPLRADNSSTGNTLVSCKLKSGTGDCSASPLDGMLRWDMSLPSSELRDVTSES